MRLQEKILKRKKMKRAGNCFEAGNKKYCTPGLFSSSVGHLSNFPPISTVEFVSSNVVDI